MRIVRPEGEKREAVPDGEVGHIAVRGPNVFAGYVGMEDSGVDEDGWLDTGDLGYRDAEGFFFLTGRAKDLIIRGGHNIDPVTIEDAFQAHHDVTLAAAVGQPDAHAGELPVVFVQRRAGATSTVEVLRDFALPRIPERAARPVHVEIVDELPVTPIGKVFKPELRRRRAERVFQELIAERGGDPASIRVERDERGALVAQVADETLAEHLAPFAIRVEVDGSEA